MNQLSGNMKEKNNRMHFKIAGSTNVMLGSMPEVIDYRERKSIAGPKGQTVSYCDHCVVSRR